MSLDKDMRLKRMMVYRLEDQLRVIPQDDIHSQILASLSRCVQSLLAPKTEKVSNWLFSIDSHFGKYFYFRDTMDLAMPRLLTPFVPSMSSW